MVAATRHVTVVVLGDVGRSPRMQYHCASLASLPNTKVSFVGHRGEKCVPSVENSPNIRQFLIGPSPFRRCSRKFFLLYAPFKVLFQVFQLLWILCMTTPRPSAILVQNPPTIPTLFAALVAAKLRGARLIIDWHNFGYTVLSHSLGTRHPLVTIARWHERFFAQFATAHICVTQAMQKWLHANWRIRATVVYDKPPEFFHACSVAEKHALFNRLGSTFATGDGAGTATGNLFTEEHADGSIVEKPDRPALLISSTSWTPDEDFGVLLEALQRVDERAPPSFPKVVVVVTGKGPQKAMYEARMAALGLQHISVHTMWLAAEDYPLLLGSADLGICLHTSTSGLDLPMKVVDMFGCELPVCAIGFGCLQELVQHEKNGLVFDTSEQLADQLFGLLKQFPTEATSLLKLRQGVRESQTARWADNWKANVEPLFTAST